MPTTSLNFPEWVDKLMRELEKEGKIKSKGTYFQNAARKGLIEQLKKDFPEKAQEYMLLYSGKSPTEE